LIGLGDIKEQIEEIIALQKLKVRREKEGLPEINPTPNHLIFSGPPGTGKTTVAKLIGNIYKSLGLVTSGHVKETQRADLVGGFIGQTAIKTAEIFAQAEGGVLFIDEAYTLTESSAQDSKDFGQEAVDTILKLMEDHRDNTVVIAAGYEEKMEKFLNSNPGLPSRFGKVMNFLPWSPKDLEGVVISELHKKSLTCNHDALKALNQVCQELVKLPAYASGRTARRFVEEVISSQSLRLAKDETSILLGTMSLWQGVDVPGESCICVVIDRIPFPRPDDPLIAARQQAIDDAGGSGFRAISVPKAGLLLAQGAGRLIRGAHDKGVVAVLDSRLANAGYAKSLRASLPPFWFTTDKEIVMGSLKRLNEDFLKD
jgi:Holliday junction resolvasome RuvABC ATP-dependent DNA helicase subunit